MEDDIFESISQRSDDAQDSENKRILAIANELHRRCKLYEEKLRDGKENGSWIDIEQCVVEQYAKESGLWLPFSDIFNLGVPGPSGNENDTYVSNDVIYKVNNLLNSGSILKFLEKIVIHNYLFSDTPYTFFAFTGFDGRSIMPVLQQYLIKSAQPATQIMIDTYMAALGFEKTKEVGRFLNSQYEVWDLVPRNVLVDPEGDIYVIDAEIKKK